MLQKVVAGKIAKKSLGQIRSINEGRKI
jgi:hypothetical protein